MRRATEATAAQQVAGFIAKFDPTVAKLARASRTVLRKRLPTASAPGEALKRGGR